MKWAHRYTILSIMWVTYGVFYLNRLNLGPVIPLLRNDMNLTHSQVGLITASLLMAYTLTQMPAGYLGDRIGPRKVITMGSLILAFGNYIFGLGRGFSQLLLGQLVNGIGQGMGWSPSIKLLTNWLHRKERAVGIGIYMTTLSVNVTTAYILSGYLGSRLGWRFSFITPASIMLVMAIACWLIIKAGPKEENSEPFTNKSDPPKRVSETDKSRAMIVLTSHPLWIITGAFACHLFIHYGFYMWIPSYLIEYSGLSVESATLTSCMIPMVGVIARPLGGLISDKTLNSKRRPLILFSFAFLTPLTFALVHVRDLMQLVLCLGLIGFFQSFPSSLFFAYITDLLSPELIGTGTGFLEEGGHLGSVLAVYTIGLLIDLFHSYTVAFLIFPVVATIGTTISFLLKE